MMFSPTEDNEVPEGRYQLVGWDIDTTGRCITDEICHIGAYTNTNNFDQYIMPYSNINYYAQRRYKIRVATVKYKRMLMDVKTKKYLDTKPAILVLTDFLTWLENIRGDATDGVILVCHEVRNVAPRILVVAMQRYNLFERFSAIVKAFGSSYILARNDYVFGTDALSLKALTRVLLGVDNSMNNAVDRARFCYLLVLHMGKIQRMAVNEEGSDNERSLERAATEMIRLCAQPVVTEERELAEFMILEERQNTFQPIFQTLMTNYVSHQYTTRLQRHLAEHNLVFEQVKNAWEHGGRMGIENLLHNMAHVTEKTKNDLLDILDCYFDPEKKPFRLQSRSCRPLFRSKKYTMGKKNKTACSRGSNYSDTSANANNTFSSPNNNATPPYEEVNVKPIIF